MVEFTTEPIPTWALCALVNDDWTGVTEEDKKTIDEWFERSKIKRVVGPISYDEYFTHYPAFGLACMVMDCACEIE